MNGTHSSKLRPRGLIIGLSIVAIVTGTACQSTEEATPVDRSGPAAPAMTMVDERHAGITDDSVLFGQSAAFTGPSQELGLQMRLGIQAAFHEQNQAGGVHGRQLELTTLDDFYEPDSAYLNTQRLINRDGVFALIGEVGTPTSRSASRLANFLGVPFVAPFTGAELLRDGSLDTVMNLRASYYQEIEGNGGAPDPGRRCQPGSRPLPERLLRADRAGRRTPRPRTAPAVSGGKLALPAEHECGQDCCRGYRRSRSRGSDHDRCLHPGCEG